MSAMCEVAAPFIANGAVDGREVIRPLRSHTGTCLKCQARHASMSRTARVLTTLADETYPAPPGLEWRVMSSLEGELAIKRTIAKPVALIAAIASMATVLLIWRLRPGAVG